MCFVKLWPDPGECREGKVETCCCDHPFLSPLCLGSLERHESGETAKAILASCEDSGLMADPLYAAWEEDGQQEKDLGGSLSSSSAFGSFSCNRLAHQRRSFCRQVNTQKETVAGCVIGSLVLLRSL